MPTPFETAQSFRLGYDRGNYGNAYESTDWESWYAAQCDKIPTGVVREDFINGMLLGFFSSYEIHEIADHGVALGVEMLRAKYGED